MALSGIASIEAAVKLNCYVTEGARHHKRLLSEFIRETLESHGTAYALFRASAGFDHDGRFYSSFSEASIGRLPVLIEATDSSDGIRRSISSITAKLDVCREVRMDLQPVRILKVSHPGKVRMQFEEVGTRTKKLVVYVNSLQKNGHEPLYKCVLRYLREKGCAGATAFRALAGYGAGGTLHSAGKFSLTPDVPIKIEVVDDTATLMAAIPGLAKLLNGGIIELQDTFVITGPYDVLDDQNRNELWLDDRGHQG